MRHMRHRRTLFHQGEGGALTPPCGVERTHLGFVAFWRRINRGCRRRPQPLCPLTPRQKAAFFLSLFSKVRPRTWVRLRKEFARCECCIFLFSHVITGSRASSDIMNSRGLPLPHMIQPHPIMPIETSRKSLTGSGLISLYFSPCAHQDRYSEDCGIHMTAIFFATYLRINIANGETVAAR